MSVVPTWAYDAKAPPGDMNKQGRAQLPVDKITLTGNRAS